MWDGVWARWLEFALFILQAIIEESIAKSAPIVPADALNMIKMLDTLPAEIPTGFKNDIKRSIGAMVGSKSASGHKDSQKLQSLPTSEDFLPEWLWDILADQNGATYYTKLFAMRKFLRSLGATNMKEASWQRLATIFYMASLKPDINRGMDVDITSYETVLKDVKTHVKPAKKEIKMPWWGKLLMYPHTPEELQKDHRDVYDRAYAAGPPVIARVDTSMLNHLCSSLPMRDTHHLVQHKKFAGVRMSPPQKKAIVNVPNDDCFLPGPFFLQDFTVSKSFFCAFLQLGVGGRRREPKKPNIDFFVGASHPTKDICMARPMS